VMYRCTRCGGKLNTGGLCPHCNRGYISIVSSESPLLPSDYQQTIDALRAELAQVKAERDRLRDLLMRWLRAYQIQNINLEVHDIIVEETVKALESE
jgi:hypothetical protein